MPAKPPKANNLERVRAALKAQPSTRRELELRLHLSTTGVWRLVEKLREADGKERAYIKKWVKADGCGKLTPLFAMGGRADAERSHPKELKRAKDKRRRARQRLSNEYEEALAKERARYWSRKLDSQKPIDPLAQALFGPCPAPEIANK